ncbi:hypothetical protein P7C70_g8658, partial [Phenoliferia sp. Uapishka_3]
MVDPSTAPATPATPTGGKIRLALLGASGTGKTTMIQQLGGPAPHEESREPTKARFTSLQFPGNGQSCPVDIELWVIPRGQRFVMLNEFFCRHAQAVIVVYSVTDVLSYTRACDLVRKLSADSQNLKRPILLFGNKIDLPRAVDRPNARQFARSSHVLHREGSALNSPEGVLAALQLITCQDTRVEVAPRGFMGELRLKIPKFRILLGGARRAGKTTTLNKVFQLDGHPLPAYASAAQDFQRGVHDVSNLVFHDSEGLEVGVSRQRDALEAFVRDRDSQPSLANRIHVIWYFIALGLRSVSAGDREFLLLVSKTKAPIIIVFTHWTSFQSLVRGTLHNPSDQDVSAESYRVFHDLRACTLWGASPIPGALQAYQIYIRTVIYENIRSAWGLEDPDSCLKWDSFSALLSSIFNFTSVLSLGLWCTSPVTGFLLDCPKAARFIMLLGCDLTIIFDKIFHALRYNEVKVVSTENVTEALRAYELHGSQSDRSRVESKVSEYMGLVDVARSFDTEGCYRKMLEIVNQYRHG